MRQVAQCGAAMNRLVVVTSVWLAWISFASFVLGSITTYYVQWKAADAAKKASEAANGAVQRAAPAGGPPGALPANAPTIGDLSELFKAITGALDVVVKAGPGLAGLIASILFLGVGCWASTEPDPRTCTINKDTVISIKDNKLTEPVIVACKSDSAKR